MDDRFLYFSNWLHGDLRQYDISDPAQPAADRPAAARRRARQAVRRRPRARRRPADAPALARRPPALRHQLALLDLGQPVLSRPALVAAARRLRPRRRDGDRPATSSSTSTTAPAAPRARTRSASRAATARPRSSNDRRAPRARRRHPHRRDDRVLRSRARRRGWGGMGEASRPPAPPACAQANPHQKPDPSAPGPRPTRRGRPLTRARDRPQRPCHRREATTWRRRRPSDRACGAGFRRPAPPARQARSRGRHLKASRYPHATIIHIDTAPAPAFLGEQAPGPVPARRALRTRSRRLPARDRSSRHSCICRRAAACRRCSFHGGCCTKAGSVRGG